MSFVQISAPNVILSTLKKCEDDDALVARLYDIEGKDSRVKLRLFVPLESAQRTNIIDEEGRPLTVESGGVMLNVGHHAIETMKMVPNQ